jgi:hypothetical protein
MPYCEMILKKLKEKLKYLGLSQIFYLGCSIFSSFLLEILCSISKFTFLISNKQSRFFGNQYDLCQEKTKIPTKAIFVNFQIQKAVCFRNGSIFKRNPFSKIFLDIFLLARLLETLQSENLLPPLGQVTGIIEHNSCRIAQDMYEYLCITCKYFFTN